jgi:hypothetical protein
MFPLRIPRRIALCALLVAATSSARAEKLRMHFDTDSAGRPPAFLDFVVWGSPGEADWLVLGDVNPPSTPNKVIQTRDGRPAGSIAVALRRNYSLADGEISVGLRRGNGQSGLVFRAVGEKDFLLLLVNAATGEARLSSWRGGKETELARGKAVTDHEWGTLAVTASGGSITGRWNGKPLLSGTDPYPASGRIGLATAGPGQMSFDELVFDIASPAAPASP